ncbi:MAG: RnfABCDGE type electron transport complex subunit G [Gemmatimonadota bacterium]|nr:MAG: RnfABCDGE type electron transport complex subunit G [Gemmatimonadota bacterium]
MSGAAGNGSGGGRVLPQAPAQREEVPAWRLLVTLGSAGAIAGLLLVFVYQATQPAIQAYKAMVLRQAVQEVLKGPERWDTLYVVDGGLTLEPPAGADAAGLEMVFLGYREDGEPIGFAITGAEFGFQDIIELIFGYDPATRTVIGMKVLSNKETPGLGDKIEKDSAFVAEFDGSQVPLAGVKAQRATGAANEVDMITGATISSRAVIGIINHRLERLGPMIEAYLEEAT